MFYHSNPPDFKEAAKWLMKSARGGHIGSQRSVGLMLREGKGLPKDDTLATQFFRAAAESGGVEAQHWETLGDRRQAQAELGYAYLTGQGVAQSDTLAAQWFLKAPPHHLDPGTPHRPHVLKRPPKVGILRATPGSGGSTTRGEGYAATWRGLWSGEPPLPFCPNPTPTSITLTPTPQSEVRTRSPPWRPACQPPAGRHAGAAPSRGGAWPCFSRLPL